MKTIRKTLAILLALTLVLALGATAFAQDVPVGTDPYKITVKNPANGETYKLYKLFDGTVSNGEISYTGTIPSGLGNYFEKPTGSSYIVAKDAAWKNNDPASGEMSDGLKTALKTWAKGATPVTNGTAVSDGSSTLVFDGVAAGYYVLTTSHGADPNIPNDIGLITVGAVKEDIELVDKNTKDEIPPVKTVNDDKVSIGDVVTFTITKITHNYLGSDPIIRYTIQDSLPDYLTDVNVNSVTIGGQDYKDSNGNTPQFTGTPKSIVIPWTSDGTNQGSFLYTSGAEIKIVYKARITDKIVAGDVDNNKNVVTVKATADPLSGDPYDETTTTEETVTTSAAALQKTDSVTGKNLAGATFAVKGLRAVGSNGNYTVERYDRTAAASDNDTVMACDEDGLLVIRGIASDEGSDPDYPLEAREISAPAGYKKLTNTVKLTPAVVDKVITVTTTTVYYNDQGNVVDQSQSTTSKRQVVAENLPAATVIKVPNTQGVDLPTTGGVGTTVFYLLGACLLFGTAVLLLPRKRVEN